jgi:hypothetical protein
MWQEWYHSGRFQMHRVDLVEQYGRERQELLLKQAAQSRQDRELARQRRQVVATSDARQSLFARVVAAFAGTTLVQS